MLFFLGSYEIHKKHMNPVSASDIYKKKNSFRLYFQDILVHISSFSDLATSKQASFKIFT